MGRDKWNFVFAYLRPFSGMNCRLELSGPNFWQGAGLYSRADSKVAVCLCVFVSEVARR